MKKYKRKRILHTLVTFYEFKILNENSDAPLYFLQHEKLPDIVLSVDRFTEQFPGDFVEKGILNGYISMDNFVKAYELSKG